MVDGLALGAMPQQAKFAADRLALVALVHHPLALETGLAPELQAALRQSESQALGQAKRVVVTSEATAGVLVADYGVAPGRIGVVLPGTDPAPTAVGSKGPALALLCVGSLVPRKGHLDLVAALARLKDLPWHLTCIGSTTRDPAVTRRLEEHIAQEGLEDRVTLAGEKPQAVLQAASQDADLFVLPSHHEGYGMALAEALAHGLPIVSTTAGAISETVPAEAGLLVPPGDVARLTEALGGLLRNEGLRMQLRGGALQMRGTLPSWDKAAACFAAELAKVPL